MQPNLSIEFLTAFFTELPTRTKHEYLREPITGSGDVGNHHKSLTKDRDSVRTAK
jgi:hypothetical protein